MCHCTQCQKAQGSAFCAVSPIATNKLTITQGIDLLKEYRNPAAAHKARVFCSVCASPLYSMRDDLPKVRRLRLGTLDTRIDMEMIKKAYHGFVCSRASWDTIPDDGFERFDGASE